MKPSPPESCERKMLVIESKRTLSWRESERCCCCCFLCQLTILWALRFPRRLRRKSWWQLSHQCYKRFQLRDGGDACAISPPPIEKSNHTTAPKGPFCSTTVGKKGQGRPVSLSPNQSCSPFIFPCSFDVLAEGESSKWSSETCRFQRHDFSGSWEGQACTQKSTRTASHTRAERNLTDAFAPDGWFIKDDW